MGLSFHDESSMMETSSGSLCFAPGDPKSPVAENGIIDEERRHDDVLDIQIVDRWIVERRDSSIHTKEINSTIIWWRNWPAEIPFWVSIYYWTQHCVDGRLHTMTVDHEEMVYFRIWHVWHDASPTMLEAKLVEAGTPKNWTLSPQPPKEASIEFVLCFIGLVPMDCLLREVFLRQDLKNGRLGTYTIILNKITTLEYFDQFITCNPFRPYRSRTHLPQS